MIRRKAVILVKKKHIYTRTTFMIGVYIPKVALRCVSNRADVLGGCAGKGRPRSGKDIDEKVNLHFHLVLVIRSISISIPHH